MLPNEVIDSTEVSVDNEVDNNDVDMQDAPVEKNQSPTGFALYSSYKPNIILDDKVLNYAFVDIDILTLFLCQFSCSERLEKSLSVKQIIGKGRCV